MGLFDAFRRRKKQPDGSGSPDKRPEEKDKAPAAKPAAVPPQPKPTPVKITGTTLTDAEVSLLKLMQLTEDGQLDTENGAAVRYEELGFEVSFVRAKCERRGARCLCHPTYFVTLPGNESIVVSSPLGIGNTKNEALEDSARTLAAILDSCFSCMRKEDVDILENEFDGSVHTYCYPCDFVGYTFGSPDMPDIGSLFAKIRDEVANYLGAKKYYWIELRVLCNDGSVSCDVEINGMPSLGLIELLQSKTEDYFGEGDGGIYYQTVLMVQDEYTYVKRRENYNRSCHELTENVKKALLVMGSGASAEEIRANLMDETGDEFAVWELMTILPELYTLSSFGMNCSDTYIFKVGGRRLRLNELQLTPIKLMFRAIDGFLREDKPDGFDEIALLRFSRVYSEVMRSKGIILLGELSFDAPEGYEIW